jgi:hypothetical protein
LNLAIRGGTPINGCGGGSTACERPSAQQNTPSALLWVHDAKHVHIDQGRVDQYSLNYLRPKKLWILFTAIKVVVGHARSFEASGLDREHWNRADRIRMIFKMLSCGRACRTSRKTLALLGGKFCKSPEE